MSSVATPALPDSIQTEPALDEFLTRPGAELVQFIKSIRTPLVILGAGGKMGPSLAVLARRAAEAAGHQLEVIAVSRFSDAGARRWLEERGIRTRCCDLFDADAVRKLPPAEDVLYLVGQKFGTTQNPAFTWAANTIVPESVSNPLKYYGNNTCATRSLLEAASHVAAILLELERAGARLAASTAKRKLPGRIS